MGAGLHSSMMAHAVSQVVKLPALNKGFQGNVQQEDLGCSHMNRFQRATALWIYLFLMKEARGAR